MPAARFSSSIGFHAALLDVVADPGQMTISQSLWLCIKVLATPLAG
jgi:hypothetical protein